MFLAVMFAGETEDLAEPLDVKIIARKTWRWVLHELLSQDFVQ